MDSWTDEQIDAIRTKYATVDTKALADLVGKPVSSVYKMANNIGVKKSQETISAIRKEFLRVNRETSKFLRSNLIHGMANDKSAGSTYNVWRSMIDRCTKTSHKSYAEYGGAGITICQEWRESFVSFLRDMGPRPQGKSLDRFPDQKGGYGPGNCRWATSAEQNRNRKDNRFITAFGETGLEIEFCERHGIRTDTFRWRLRDGWSVEEALTKPVRPHHRKKAKGTK